ncbi:isomerase [Sphingobium sp. LB126]|uniref:fumarylacetoacetate hydrolase family protein n=1 Tax=Sphingobium sp. LB126 TaxID=1983755 RepID=UPI000C1FF3EE|nr:fumarylacetoacetate hydrolase family protein [Sphingobium sp. LB126]PJG49770.1 isomerase [Sphingobium sp. LB126]
MKLATVAGHPAPRVCAVFPETGEILDLQAAHRAATGEAAPAFASMQDLIAAGAPGLNLAREMAERGAAREALASVRLLAPVPEPIQMRDGLLFEKHCLQAFAKARELRASRAADPAAEMADMEARGILRVPDEFYSFPLYYKQNRFSVSGPEEDVIWPAYSQVMDYELEFAVFIGTTGIDIPREAARSHIFGYTIFNDFSARDAQVAEAGGGLGPAKGKDFKGANAIGPWIVTADEIGDPYDLNMVVRVNGEERGRGHTGAMHWRFEDLIAWVSDGEELRAGEFLGSGTVGNGCGLEFLRFLEHGDVVELEVEKIGVLRNRVLRPERMA